MPHINRIRVNNVKYNFGTQFYDDFILRFDGKNALYDLANGGGKSVLMLLLFQNLIPNCTLDEKQPIEKLFRTDQGSTTIHSLIEWRLDDRFVRDGYKYMLTGFCARKAREELRETAAIEYFNYVIFYRGYNDNDLVNLPLSNGKERVTYSGLKAYLKDLGRKDMGLDVHIFERKGEYQRYISQYGLYESHWEILRGINRTEGHVRTYFENRYKTTRRVVEDLLIEEIIQKAFLQGSQPDTDMADTLVQIKDKLAELALRKEEIGGYDRQAEILDSFSGRVLLLKNAYEDKEKLDRDLVKTYHTANGVYRLKEKELAVFQKEKDYAQKHIFEISRKLDTVRIQEDQEHLKQLEADTEKYADTLRQLQEDVKKKQQDLDMAEASGMYADYLEVRSKWETLKEFLSQDKSDSEGMLAELQQMARIRYALNEEEKQTLNKKLALLETALKETEKEYEEARQKERQLFSDSAVLNSQISEAKQRQKDLNGQWNSLCRQVPVLLLENVGQSLREKQQQRQSNGAKISELSERQAALDLERGERTSEMGEKRHLLKQLEKEKRELGDFLNAYEAEKQKRDKLLQVYHAEDGQALSEMIEEQLRKVILDWELKRQETENLEEKLDNLSKGSPSVMNSAVETVMEYIRRCHGKKCVFGGDYLKEINDYDRKILLARIPFLPESVIVESGLSEIKEDRILLEKDFGDVIVPIISLAQVMRQEEVVRDSEVLFLSKNPEWYMDENVRQEACEALEKQLEKSREMLVRLEDRERTIQADQKYMTGFELNYQQYYPQRSQRWAQVNQELDKTLSAIKKGEEELAANVSEKERLIETLEKMDAANRQLDEDIKVLEQMKLVEEELRSNEDKQQQLSISIEENEKSRKLAAEKIQWSGDTMDRFNGEKRSAREALVQIDTFWNSHYAMYYIPGESEAYDLSADELDAKFTGLKEAYEKEHHDLEDKRQLLDSYQQMMDTLLNSIRRKDISIYNLENMAKEHRLVLTEKEKIEAMEKEIAGLKAEIAHQEEILFRYREDKNKLFGSVTHGVSTIEEKYGVFQAVSVLNDSYAEFTERQKEALRANNEKEKQAEEGIQNTYRELRVFDDIRRDLERMIQNEGVRFNCTNETYGAEVDVRAKHKELNDKYQKMRSELQRKREGFERDKEKAVEDLHLLSAEELASSMRTEIRIPSSVSEAQELIGQLTETMQIVRMEKERIEKTIHDMVEIKRNFEKQCLQRCVSIKAELERFPEYSRIHLDGKQVPMVMLKIPYVKEEMYEQRMSEYIDAIVARTDSYASQEERVAYIRQQLSWKRLFSVIVTDMNSIRLSLYKRERVKEQSRYLKYEEAVGSTGQSQGIYIQFLIGVINYISVVYSGFGDGADLQKVIFIDNPFGAAKDIYIWQPIFELLRTNHVQLIVPTRGATPAITGRFDINYILGQKMIDKIQQTVVVDYSSNVDVQSMEYEKLEFEQEVFDFI